MTDAAIAARFDAERPRLMAIATRLTGSSADAEDAVQDTWLRLARTEPGAIENLPAWLTTVVSRVSLDLLKSPSRRREQPWQIEPWREPTAHGPDPADVALRNDEIGVALLVVLDRLSPAERIAFVLHDVFGLPFDEIAHALGRTSDAARQLASRGRRRVRGASLIARASAARDRSVVEAWLRAARDGDFTALMALLDDGAVLRADYGSSDQVLKGARTIADQAVLSARLAAHSTLVLIDGRPGVAASIDGRVVSVMAFGIADGRVTSLDVLADRQRLDELGVNRLLSRPADHHIES